MARSTSFVPKIMIVDDEPLIRMYARQIVEEGGYTAIEATDADHALQLLADNGVTALVTVQMPGSINGLELARKVKATWLFIAVMAVATAG